MSKKIDKETALKYYNTLKNAYGYGTKEYEMKETLENDENFILIEEDVKTSIEEMRIQLTPTRLQKLEESLKESFYERDEDDDDEEEDEIIDVVGYENIVSKLLADREYDDYDHDNLLFEQRVSFDDSEDAYSGNPKQIDLDSLSKKIEKIKTKHPGKKIYVNSVASGTMSVDRIRVYAVIKKLKPLYEIYNYIFHQVQRQLEDHKREVEAFKKKQKELGL